MAVWNTDPTFSLLHSGDTGNIPTQNYSASPGGGGSWGLQGRTFQPPPDSHLDWQRYVASGDGLYLYGKEERGRLGFVRCIQGNIWRHQVLWHTPAPLPIRNKTLMVGLELFHDTSHLGHSGRAWVMHALNVWLSSPHFPLKPDGDCNLRKPLVLDLAFYQSSRGSGLRSHESSVAYHYQESVDTLSVRSGRSYYFDLSQYLARALGTFAALRGKADVRLYQLEYVIELRDAEGAAKINRFQLQW